LLLKALSPSQRESYLKSKYFDVDLRGEAKESYVNRSAFPFATYRPGTYRIRHQRSNNVEHLQSRDIYCIVLEKPCPTPDIMLAVKLTLEQDPEKFFRTAFRSSNSGMIMVSSIDGPAANLLMGSRIDGHITPLWGRRWDMSEPW